MKEGIHPNEFGDVVERQVALCDLIVLERHRNFLARIVSMDWAKSGVELGAAAGVSVAAGASAASSVEEPHPAVRAIPKLVTSAIKSFFMLRVPRKYSYALRRSLSADTLLNCDGCQPVMPADSDYSDAAELQQHFMTTSTSIGVAVSVFFIGVAVAAPRA